MCYRKSLLGGRHKNLKTIGIGGHAPTMPIPLEAKSIPQSP